jgi:hypothetical protein
MDIHPPWGNQLAMGINLLRGVIRDLADFGNFSVVNRDITGEAVSTGSINDCPIADDQIVHGDASYNLF